MYLYFCEPFISKQGNIWQHMIVWIILWRPICVFDRGPDPLDCGTVTIMAWVNDSNLSLSQVSLMKYYRIDLACIAAIYNSFQTDLVMQDLEIIFQKKNKCVIIAFIKFNINHRNCCILNLSFLNVQVSFSGHLFSGITQSHS